MIENTMLHLIKDKVVSRLSGLAEMSRGVAELEKFNQSEPGSIILFQTWEIDKFCKYDSGPYRNNKNLHNKS